MNLNNMKVGTRLALGFALVLVLLVAVAVVGILRMAQIQDRLDHVVSVSNVSTGLVVEMRNNVSDRLASLRVLTLMTDPADMEPEIVKFKEQTAKYDAAQAKLAALFATYANDQEKTLLNQIKEHEATAMPAIARATDLYLAANAMGATRVMIREVRPVQRKWTDALNALSALEDKQNAQSKADAETAFANARNFMLVLLVLAVVIGIVAAVVITRSLLKQLGGEPAYTAKIAGSIAHGDLSIAIDTKASDRGSLLVEMKEMRNSLVGIVEQVRRGTETIGTASREIAAGNIDLSSRTELQASSLEKTASAMEELTATVKQNADSAREANALAATASDVARKGGDVVSQVVGTMGEINTSANKISDIIGVIDGIAFQTNILALNAAVEAARAGEQGRGFAVVASEVRNLAQRSAAAAKEIKVLIGDSVDKVGVGAKLVDQAGATMEQVVSSIRRVTDIMAEITHASQEQTGGIEQVNQAIGQMDQVTQQNAALVEEAAAAAASMQDQAATLAQVVGVFKLDRAHDVTPPAQHQASRPVIKTAAATPARIAARPAATPRKDKFVSKAASKPVAAGAGDWEEF